MTRTASCKTGRARFTQDFVVTSPAVLAALFAEVDTSGKAWKMKKIGSEDFQDRVGKETVEGSVRYDTLYITSDVTCRWVEGEGVLKISGCYGKVVER